MSNAIIMQQTGGPDVLRWEPFDPGTPQEGEAIVRHEAVGLNFIDVYHRTGLYPIGDLPAIPGMEGAGTVEAVGPGVTDIAKGDRVAYAGLPPGGLCRTPTDSRPSAGQTSCGDYRPPGRGHDAARYDGPLSSKGLHHNPTRRLSFFCMRRPVVSG